MDKIEFEKIYSNKLLTKIESVKHNPELNCWIKRKFNVFEFLHDKYNTNIINFTKRYVWKDYRINNRNDLIGNNKFNEFFDEYIEIMEIDYKSIHKLWGRKYDSEQEKQNPYINK